MKFDQKYNHDVFSEFLRDFLPEDYVEKEKDIVDLSRCKIITSARELGHSSSLNVSVLEMAHAKETDPRVSIATDAFKILATFGYDKALVIFKNDESENYRFSYLTISLNLNEKNKVVAKYSNARRYSFYLGEGAKTKTPEQQLVKRGRIKDTADLLSRFSLEVVNKQFYLEIAKFFDDLVDEKDANLALPSQLDPTVRKNFAMRLIGRLMFCWFLKQKKSKDGALVPEELLSASAVKDGYYHAILEPLFFEILNTQIDERDIRSDVYDKVPYLNGGLFSPQYDDYYELDRATFTSRHINTLRVADAWFREFFALLETYNFTIDENTVFDQELSVDPEMLGRIFENLLAEINPETGSSERKRTGSYYTPRQVVEYMVDQSLIEYLKTATGIEEKRLAALVSYDLGDDEGNQLTTEENKKAVEAIEELKILDPACGSGAFPIGALQKIVWILQRIDPNCKLWLERKLEQVPELYRKKITDYFQNNPPDYIRKLDVIKDSIFGVDIQPIAVEMSRLRCFLTLVVESEIDDTKKNRGIEPLPNLDFKFVCANTLVGLPKKGSNGLFEDHTGIEELSVIMSDYFSANRTEREGIKNRFHNKQKELLNRMIERKAVGDLTLRLTNWEPFENEPSSWFDPAWMFGEDAKFDVVIANPPYVKREHLDEEDAEQLAQIFTEEISGKTKKWADDLYVHFIFKGYDLTKKDGVLTFVTNDSFIALASKERVRRLMLANDLRQVVKCPAETFEATIYVAVFVLQKRTSAGQSYSTGRFNFPAFDYRYLGDVPYALVETLPNKRLMFADSLVEVYARLAGDKKVKDYLSILDTGIHSGNVRSRVFFSDNITGTLDKLIQGKQIDRWGVYWDAPKAKYKYVDIHYVPKTGKGIGRGGKESKLEEWLRVGDIENHHQPERLLMRQTDDDLVVAFQDEVKTGRLYTDNTLFTILPKGDSVSLKYAMAILNSRLLNSLYHTLSQEEGKTLAQVKVKLVEELPFRVGNQTAIVEIVDKILKLTSSDDYLQNESKQQQVEAYEKEVDRLVFELYELTGTEMKAIKSE